MGPTQDSFMFTVGKLDAGMAILLGERAHLIEFPSLLLPPGVSTGSIVNISVHRNVIEEKKREGEFWDLQDEILAAYGSKTPEFPKLELRNVTQTSVTLEWPRLELATAKLRSLDLYRDRKRVAAIPTPMSNTSTKVSGLALDTDYTFQLILRTTAGVYQSNVLNVHTHTITDTSGISVCFGTVEDEVLLENVQLALREMGAKWSDKVQIDTTHFVCTTPAATPAAAAAQAAGTAIIIGPGVEYQKALQLSIPVVQPHWVLACHSEKKMVPIRPYYLGETPATPAHYRNQSLSQAALSSPTRGSGAGTPTHQQRNAANRQSMPPQRVTSASPPVAARGASSPTKRAIEPTPEEPEEAEEPRTGGTETDEEEAERLGRRRKGTMTKNFKFPPPTPAEEVPPVPGVPRLDDGERRAEGGLPTVTPSSVEVPPPPPVDKERPLGAAHEMVDDDVGETEEISLN